MTEKITLSKKIKSAISGKKTILFSILGVLVVGLTLTAFAAKQRHSYSHLNSNSGSWDLFADSGNYGDKHSKRKGGRHHMSGRDHNRMRDLMHGSNSLAEYDLDQDGVLSLEERQTARADQFKKLDANNNSSVEETEFLNFFAKTVEKRVKANFILMDTNEDNLLTKEELSERRGRGRTSFKTTDADGNGDISLDEYVATYLDVAKRQSKAAFIILDDNEDKALSQEEFKSFPPHRGKKRF